MALDAREHFIAVQKNGDGDLTAFKTSSGRILDYDQAKQEVQAGAIASVNLFKGRDGEMYIRGMPTATLPTTWTRCPVLMHSLPFCC